MPGLSCWSKYTSFTEGKITPDLMLLCYEPLLLLIMAMAEKVDVEYKLDDDITELDDLDADEATEVNNSIQGLTDLYKGKNEQVKLKEMQNTAANLQPEVKEELEEVETEEIKSLLARG